MREHQLIRRTPGVLGGRACIRGTRVAVYMIIQMIRNDMSTGEILDDYPDLTREDITAACLYAIRNHQEIEADINGRSTETG